MVEDHILNFDTDFFSLGKIAGQSFYVRSKQYQTKTNPARA